MNAETALVIGLGEVGGPLADILASVHTTYRKDIEPLELAEPLGVLHICYPYQVGDFVGVSAAYVAQYRPNLVMVHNTIPAGTTRALYNRTGVPIAYSATRGKHTRMKEDLLTYTKFVAGVTKEATRAAEQHLRATGMSTAMFSTPEALELAKLLETTYFGLLLAWSQEMERYCRGVDAEYNEVMKFMQEINYLPPVVFQPGYIGGHCVIPNSYLLDKVAPSEFTVLMRHSNDVKAKEWLQEGRSLEEHLTPIRYGS